MTSHTNDVNRDEGDDDVSNFDYDEEIDLKGFEVGYDQLLGDWKIPQTPRSLNKLVLLISFVFSKTHNFLSFVIIDLFAFVNLSNEMCQAFFKYYLNR